MLVCVVLSVGALGGVVELSGRTDGRAGGAGPKQKPKKKHENQISGRLFVVVVVVGEREKRSVAHTATRMQYL